MDTKNWFHAAVIVAACYLFFELVLSVGFLIVSPIALFILIFLLGLRPWKFVLRTSILITALVYGVFFVIGLPLPSGLLPF